MATSFMDLPPVAVTMSRIFATMFAGLAALSLLLDPVTRGRGRGGAVWLPPASNPSKRAAELLAWALSPCWIASVGANLRQLWVQRHRVLPRA